MSALISPSPAAKRGTPTVGPLAVGDSSMVYLDHARSRAWTAWIVPQIPVQDSIMYEANTVRSAPVTPIGDLQGFGR